MSRELPVKPNLEHLKKQAKELVRSLGPDAKLSDAQHAIAREYGFANWAALKEQVESLARARMPGELLLAAVRASDADRTAGVLAEYPELERTINEPREDYGGMQLIFAAVQRTDRKTIDVLLEAGADIHARSRSATGGMGVLDECAPELAEFLMDRGAQVDVHSAARLTMVQKLRELLAADPGSVNARGAGGQTPLHFASTVEIAEILLEAGAEIDARDLQHDSTPAQHMLRVTQARHYPRDRKDVARYLVSRGCRTDIWIAAALGDLELARAHLRENPDCVRERVAEGSVYMWLFGHGRTPHQVARDFGHADVFRLLMDSSPEDVKLSQAFELGDEQIFHTMLASRPRMVETLSEEDKRQLPNAAQNNNTGAVRLMLGAGWPVDTTGEYKMTALQWASWHGNAAMVREILRRGPQIEVLCAHHITALGSALHGSMNGWHRDTGDYVATVEALMDAGAKAPEVTEELEASEAVKEALRQRSEK